MKKSDEYKRSLQGKLTELSEFSRSLTPETMTAEATAKMDKMDEAVALLSRQIEIEERSEKAAAGAAEAHKEQEELESKGADKATTEALERKLFIGYIQGRDVTNYTEAEKRSLQEMQKRGQTIGDSAKGGITTPEYFSNQLIKEMKDFSGVMQLVNIMTTENGNTLNLLRGSDLALAVPIAEATAAAAQDVTFEGFTIGAKKFSSGLFRVSNELLTDSIINIEQYIMGAMSDRFGRAVNRYCTVQAGGASYPVGYALKTNGFVNSDLAAPTAVTYNELVDIVQSVDPAYLRMGGLKWSFNQGTEAAIRKLKDTTGLPIWSMGDITRGAPATLLGFPYQINNDMGSLGTAGATVISFGDLKSGYTLRIVAGAALKKSTELLFSSDEAAFVGFMRFDGQVANENAVKLLSVAV